MSTLKVLKDKQRVFRVFYRDYVNDVVVSSAQPESLLAERIAPLAESVLQHADNFIGVIDSNELVLQFYLDDDESSVFVELLYPEDKGMLRLNMPWDQAVALLTGLPEAFDESLLPGAQFISV
jgi:hypothetical protein